LPTNSKASATNASTASSISISAAGWATDISRAPAGPRIALPAIGSTPSTSDTASASASANCPSSAIIAASVDWRPARRPTRAALACSLPGRLLELRRRADRVTGALARFGGLGCDVVLVVLGQHLARLEAAIALERTLRDDAATLLEQVGQDAGERDLDRPGVVGHGERDRGAVADPFHAVGDDQPADPERLAPRGLAVGDLRRRIEEHQIAAERVEHERGGHRQCAEPGDDPQHSLVTRFHRFPSPEPAVLVVACSARMSAARRQLSRRWRRSKTSSTISAIASIPYELHT